MSLTYATRRVLLTPGKGVGVTFLRREADGTVTVASLAVVRALSLTREANGTVTCS